MDDVVKTVKTSSLAVWSLILGILSIVCIGFLAGIPAIICGHLAKSEIKRAGGSLEGTGLALAGLITGYIGTVFSIIAIILSLVAIPICATFYAVTQEDKPTPPIMKSVSQPD